MERYYEDYNRKLRSEQLREHDIVFDYEQIKDVLNLLKSGRYPDGTFSDNECNLWALFKEELPGVFPI